MWAVLLLLSACSGVLIDNTIPRRDVNGNIINAHDGHIQHFENVYWLFGTSYTHCNMTDSTSCLGTCGWNRQTPPQSCGYPNHPSSIPNHPACGWTNNDLAAYSSSDLQTWSLRNPSLIPGDQRPNGIYFRPKVIFNPSTKLYVLWFNYVTEGAGRYCSAEFPNCWSTYGTATSRSPHGPFKISQLPVLMGTRNASYAHGDFALLVDGPKAFILYNAYDHRAQGQHSNSIDLLTPAFTSSTKQTSGFFAEWINGSDTGGDEAQVMLKRGSTYYAIIASGCCFCSQGSTAIVYTASDPLGPYTTTGYDINLNGAQRAIAAQQSFVLTIPTDGTTRNSTKVSYIWGGDRWQSAPDGFKSHDYQVWVPLSFEEDGTIKPLRWVDRWELEL